MEISSLLALARIKLDDPLWDDLDDDSLFKTDELVEYINAGIREIAFRGMGIVHDGLPIDLVAGISEYNVPDGVITVSYMYDEDNLPIRKVQEVDLDSFYDNSYHSSGFHDGRYKDSTAAIPTHYFQNLTPNTITFYPTPSTATTVTLRGTFVPIIANDFGANDDLPSEIPEMYHRDLIHWILYEAFDRPDADTYDPKKSERSKQRFIDIFGEKLPADQYAEIIAYPDDPGSLRDY